MAAAFSQPNHLGFFVKHFLIFKSFKLLNSFSEINQCDIVCTGDKKFKRCLKCHVLFVRTLCY